MTANSESDPLLSFLEASTAERLRMALKPDYAPMIEQYLGADAFAEYVLLARTTVRSDHLAAGRTVNLVFVPGIMGTSLKSAGLGGIWWLQPQSRHHIDDLRLSRDGAADAYEEYRITPVEVAGSYEGFLAAVHLRDASIIERSHMTGGSHLPGAPVTSAP